MTLSWKRERERQNERESERRVIATSLPEADVPGCASPNWNKAMFARSSGSPVGLTLNLGRERKRVELPEVVMLGPRPAYRPRKPQPNGIEQKLKSCRKIVGLA